MDDLYCITVESGGPLTDPLRNLLFDAAQEMLEEIQKSRMVRTSVGEGEVTTKFDSASIGGVSGVVFNAHLDTNRGTIKVAYLVRPSEHVRARNIGWDDPVPIG